MRVLAMRVDSRRNTIGFLNWERLELTEATEARMSALFQMMLSQAIVLDRIAPGTGAGTIDMAEAFGREAAKQGHQAEADYITGMVDQIRTALGLAVND